MGLNLIDLEKEKVREYILEEVEFDFSENRPYMESLKIMAKASGMRH